MVNAEFFDALEQLEKEKGIPVDYMLDRVSTRFLFLIFESQRI